MFVFGDSRDVSPGAARAAAAFARHTIAQLVADAAERAAQQQQQNEGHCDSAHSGGGGDGSSVKSDDGKGSALSSSEMTMGGAVVVVQVGLDHLVQCIAAGSPSGHSSNDGSVGGGERGQPCRYRMQLLGRLARALQFKALQDALVAPAPIPPVAMAPPHPPPGSSSAAGMTPQHHQQVRHQMAVPEDPLLELLSKVPSRTLHGARTGGRSGMERGRSGGDEGAVDQHMHGNSSCSGGSGSGGGGGDDDEEEETVSAHKFGPDRLVLFDAADRVLRSARLEVLLDDPVMSLPIHTLAQDGGKDGRRAAVDLVLRLLDTELTQGDTAHNSLRTMLDSFATCQTVDRETRDKASAHLESCMTLDEYTYFSKCRSQNFHTSRARFVEWIGLAGVFSGSPAAAAAVSSLPGIVASAHGGRRWHTAGRHTPHHQHPLSQGYRGDSGDHPHPVQFSEELLFLLQYLAWELIGRVTLAALVVRRDMEHLPLEDMYEENIALSSGIVTPYFRGLVSSRYARGSPAVPRSTPGAKRGAPTFPGLERRASGITTANSKTLLGSRPAPLQRQHVLEAARRLHEKRLLWG